MRRWHKTAADYLADHKARPTDWVTDAIWWLHQVTAAIGGSRRASKALAYARGRYHLDAKIEDDWSTEAWKPKR